MYTYIGTLDRNTRVSLITDCTYIGTIHYFYALRRDDFLRFTDCADIGTYYNIVYSVDFFD